MTSQPEMVLFYISHEGGLQCESSGNNVSVPIGHSLCLSYRAEFNLNQV